MNKLSFVKKEKKAFLTLSLNNCKNFTNHEHSIISKERFCFLRSCIISGFRKQRTDVQTRSRNSLPTFTDADIGVFGGAAILNYRYHIRSELKAPFKRYSDAELITAKEILTAPSLIFF